LIDFDKKSRILRRNPYEIRNVIITTRFAYDLSDLQHFEKHRKSFQKSVIWKLISKISRAAQSTNLQDINPSKQLQKSPLKLKNFFKKLFIRKVFPTKNSIKSP
jgi:hypothetical protein